ncbi:beta-propeller domain-containing protein [Piscinibacter sakaiensis]|uniref:Lipoprotein n=1 Tax=Piscinibacter sakaiensis TaxID=1547922 RepID=A0A0K8NZX7_PISS1|nr:beta-propeller domain-containing protein [Piscinibacter sakaiensis]GAP35936.1 hypothetical protein ISF6_1776 [Piscinibacter sakaiensis]
MSPRLALAACLALLAGCSATDPSAAQAPAATLTAFRSEDELMQALQRWRAGAEAQRRSARASGPAVAYSAAPQAMAAPPPAPAAAAKGSAAEAAADAGITNVQTAGVDEGGIVKALGEHLVILRRGRLFTVRVGGDRLEPVAMEAAYAPGADPRGAWYDELLVSGSTVVVVGYSAARGGTEIGLFEMDRDGRLSHRATHHLRSGDYYSSRNYASRLIGRTLVFYAPVPLPVWGPFAPAELLPAWRRWQPQALPADFRRILPATRIYRSDDEFDPSQPLVLHQVTRCALADGADLRCESTGVLGPQGRVFHVSAGSVYVWTSPVPRFGRGEPAEAAAPASTVFRLPLDGGAPSGLKTAGVPVDSFSFLEDGEGRLNVLVREQGRGEGMFGAERGTGRLALLRVPLAEFGDGRGAARREHYRRLPGPDGGPLQNRYVGDWLLWGGGDAAWALRWRDGQEATALAPGHAVERIEALGRHAVLVGNAGTELRFSSLRLDRDARLAGVIAQAAARQGETRSHGFFYRPTGPDEGLLGLPVIDAARRVAAAPSGAAGSAAVLVLRERALDFSRLGELRATAGPPAPDGCQASCVDWYGNARPIFLGERVFALLGYELVEGRLAGRGGAERLDERRRISFAPGRGGDAGGRYSPFAN